MGATNSAQHSAPPLPSTATRTNGFTNAEIEYQWGYTGELALPGLPLGLAAHCSVHTVATAVSHPAYAHVCGSGWGKEVTPSASSRWPGKSGDWDAVRAVCRCGGVVRMGVHPRTCCCRRAGCARACSIAALRLWHVCSLYRCSGCMSRSVQQVHQLIPHFSCSACAAAAQQGSEATQQSPGTEPQPDTHAAREAPRQSTRSNTRRWRERRGKGGEEGNGAGWQHASRRRRRTGRRLAKRDRQAAASWDNPALANGHFFLAQRARVRDRCRGACRRRQN